jgi:hypothetical protein
MSADFLPDGRVALGIQVPPTGERQPWAYDPKAARTDRLGRADAPGALPMPWRWCRMEFMPRPSCTSTALMAPRPISSP